MWNQETKSEDRAHKMSLLPTGKYKKYIKVERKYIINTFKYK